MNTGWFRPWNGKGYDERLRRCRNLSGAYIIRRRATGVNLYVGESHTGNLYDTVTRHFRAWSGETAGFTVDRGDVEVRIKTCPPSAAPGLQNKWIKHLDPRSNRYGRGHDDEPDF